MMNHLQAVDSDSAIYAEANSRGVMPARIAIENNIYSHLGAARYWREPMISSQDTGSLESGLSLLGDDLLSDLSRSISQTIQFPENTIFAHGLGVVASAMSKSFRFEYGNSDKPVNLYVVTAQPPSTGKSGVNEILSEPVHEAFETVNKTAAVEQKKIKIRLASAKAQMKKAETKEQQFAIEDEITDLYKQHDKHTVYTYALDDATPEATAKIALSQKGLFNIISAEADAINVILGGVYSDKKANYGIFLKGWDAERHHVARSGQETMSGRVVGNIAVIAQDESIKTILEAGESGRGISERFLIVREKTFLGSRTFGKTKPLNSLLTAEYGRMIFNIVREKAITFKFSDEASTLINRYREQLEPEMGDHGLYSNNMMRGFIGKADKQIMKIASILHCIENWRDGGAKSCEIQDTTVKIAMKIFKAIVSAYTSAADELGFTGADSEYKKVEEKIIAYAEKGKHTVTVSQLRSNLKGIKPFTGTPQLTIKLREVLLPALEDSGICIVHKDKIYINPHLKG